MSADSPKGYVALLSVLLISAVLMVLSGLSSYWPFAAHQTVVHARAYDIARSSARVCAALSLRALYDDFSRGTQDYIRFYIEYENPCIANLISITETRADIIIHTSHEDSHVFLSLQAERLNSVHHYSEVNSRWISRADM